MLGRCFGTIEKEKNAQKINITKTPKDDDTIMQSCKGTLCRIEEMFYNTIYVVSRKC
jgi:hypothetical protein